MAKNNLTQRSPDPCNEVGSQILANCRVGFELGSSDPLCSTFSGLKHYNENRKNPGSNPTRRSAGLWDLTLLQGSKRLSRRI